MIRFTGQAIIHPPTIGQTRQLCPPGSFAAPPRARRRLLGKGYLEFPQNCYSRIISVSTTPPPMKPWGMYGSPGY